MFIVTNKPTDKTTKVGYSITSWNTIQDAVADLSKTILLASSVKQDILHWHIEEVAK